jgi:hypothetical protein
MAVFDILWTMWLDSTVTSKPAGGAAGAKSIRGLEKKAQDDLQIPKKKKKGGGDTYDPQEGSDRLENLC